MSGQPRAGGRRRPMVMLVHSYYDEDPRVRREAEALVARGRPVDVIGLRRPDDPPDGVLAGVHLTRIDVQRHQGAGLATYLREYVSFMLRAGWAATRAHRRRHYAVAQVHSLPDFLVFATLPLRIVGVPVILDLHEAMPELFRTRFPRAANPLVHRLLVLQERLSIGYATVVFSVNELMRDRLVALGRPADKLIVVPNAPDLARFDPAIVPVRPFRADGRLRIVYTGALTPVYELDVALRALARIVAGRPDLDACLELYGRGDSEADLRALAAGLGIGERVTFHGRIPLEDVPAAVAAADLGIAPTRLDDFTATSLSTKVFEYAALRKPVVASRLPLVERTFGTDTVVTYPSGDDAAMAAAVIQLADDEDDRRGRVERAAARVAELGWATEADRYAAIVDRPRSAPARRGCGRIDGSGAATTR